MNPENNVAATQIEQDVYSKVALFDVLWQVLLYLSLAGLVLSLFTGRFIGVEMIGVIQVAFIGLSMI